MADDSDAADRLRALEARLAEVRAGDSTASAVGEAHRQGQLAWRMVIELVAGLLIGCGMGYGIDWALGTTPWFMVIFTLLGFVAGIKTMLRSAAEVQDQAAQMPHEEGDADGERSER